MSLPVVKEEVVDAVLAQMNGTPYMNQLWERMAEDNPVLLAYICRVNAIFTRQHGELVAQGTANCIGMLYRMLENQDEANQLSELFDA